MLAPDYIEKNLDRLLKLLGPDLSNILNGLAEDLVASTVRAAGGRTIMTGGGPDEAGRGYDHWALQHCGLDEELAWHRVAEQFSSSEGVRAGLVFGEHGIENRVPLADLIELAAHIRPEYKRRVYRLGGRFVPRQVRMESKIFWRAMGEVVFNVLDCPHERSVGQCPKLVGNLRHLATISPTLEEQARTGALARDITELAEEIGTAAAVR